MTWNSSPASSSTNADMWDMKYNPDDSQGCTDVSFCELSDTLFNSRKFSGSTSTPPAHDIFPCSNSSDALSDQFHDLVDPFTGPSFSSVVPSNFPFLSPLGANDSSIFTCMIPPAMNSSCSVFDQAMPMLNLDTTAESTTSPFLSTPDPSSIRATVTSHTLSAAFDTTEDNRKQNESKPNLCNALANVIPIPTLSSSSTCSPTTSAQVPNTPLTPSPQILSKSKAASTEVRRGRVSKTCRQKRLGKSSPASTTCYVCGKTYTESSNLSKHIRTVHMKLRPFQCELCPSSFAEKNKLRKHIQSVHHHCRPYKCDLCPATFSQASDRKRHRQVLHEGCRPFQCNSCGKAFGRRSSLTQHCSRIHRKPDQPSSRNTASKPEQQSKTQSNSTNASKVSEDIDYAANDRKIIHFIGETNGSSTRTADESSTLLSLDA